VDNEGKNLPSEAPLFNAPERGSPSLGKKILEGPSVWAKKKETRGSPRYQKGSIYKSRDFNELKKVISWTTTSQERSKRRRNLAGTFPISLKKPKTRKRISWETPS